MNNQFPGKGLPKNRLLFYTPKLQSLEKSPKSIEKPSCRPASSRSIINCSKLFSLEKTAETPISNIHQDTDNELIRKAYQGSEGDDSLIMEIVEMLDLTTNPVPKKSVETTKKTQLSLKISKSSENIGVKVPFRMRRISIKPKQ